MTARLLTICIVTQVALVTDNVAGRSLDRIRKINGLTNGKVVGVTPLKVTVRQGGQEGREIEIDAHDVVGITFGGEPKELTQARLHVIGGRFENALESLNQADVHKVKQNMVRQDIEFYRALCIARLALAGNGQVEAAGKLMHKFIKQNPNSYHYLQACETLGDLLLDLKKYDKAASYYAKLAKSPRPETKMRSQLLVGRALQAEGKFIDALAKFEEVLNIDVGSDDTQRVRADAMIGKAVCLAETGRDQEGIDLINGLIVDSDLKDFHLLAKAYNALGRCYLKGDKKKDALLAYLQVHLIYHTIPVDHAEALGNLIPLWESMGRTERARDAKKLLQERYPNSRWGR